MLGPHEIKENGRRALAVRAFFPTAESAWVVEPDQKNLRPMRRIHPSGVYEAICPLPPEGTSRYYRLRQRDRTGHITTMCDPYSFNSYFTDFDLHLFGEGKLIRAYEKLGAQRRAIDNVSGTNFAVWAPGAEHVSVIGDFNDWDGRRHPMSKRLSSGIWELFIPEIGDGHHYKFRVQTAAGNAVDKADPFGFAAEVPPQTASQIVDLHKYQWQDEAWMRRRTANRSLNQPISIYEVHLGSWRCDSQQHNGWMNYRDLAHQLVEYCKEMGFTHLELMPVSEHPFTGSWGYQTVGYFSATSRYGTPEDLMYFVDYCHQHDIGVILDWVPAHFPRDEHGLAKFDGSALFEHADPRQGEHPDWGTLIFNYGRHEVRNFLISNAAFWFDKYHVDGLRVDAVASMLYLDYSRKYGEWIPNQDGGRENFEAIRFLREFNEIVHREFPGVLTIAEESTAWEGVSSPTTSGGLGFSLKWNMGWMNDTLAYMRHEPVHRRYHHEKLTFGLVYAFTENFTLPFSHDEVVHEKGSLLEQMPGDLWQKFANLRLLYSYMWTHPGKKLLFMGNEFGQWKEWDHEGELQWELLQTDTHRGLQKMIGDLNAIYRAQPSLYEVDFAGDGFEWIDCLNHSDSILSYIRRADDAEDFLVICCNFTPIVREGIRIGVPKLTYYDEIFCSDSEFYGGTNVGNNLGVQAYAADWQGRAAAIDVTLPPLGAVLLKPRMS